MLVLENRVPVGPLQAVDHLDCGLGIVRAVLRPGDQKGSGKVGYRAAHRLREVEACLLPLLGLDPAYAEHKACGAIVLGNLQHAFGQADRFLDVAFGKRSDESTVEQFRVFRIVTQGRAVIGRSGDSVALLACMARGKVIARWRDACRVRFGRRLGGEEARQHQDAECGSRHSDGLDQVRHAHD